ncbi:multidrug ABC transporter ATPase [Deinococcus phoenicis]|uniref:Multidrug ABC transporter ATPase n=1 Tax=Deinococcus phoenicis TaxID=1476583 RepID=A0A016QM81_9DEIO|nr:ABC transporter ATP-binding protein [Deinococcus phoenicis]EYB67168.1 multidrug ABC transporter ATPase [Deinococcus phoenicis]
MNAIETAGLGKRYGRSVGLHPLDLEVKAGEIYGFLGPNGAGKTTTLRTLLGFLRPTSGTARVFGRDVWRERGAVHARVGYLPGEVHLNRDLTGGDLLDRTARLRGLPDTASAREIAGRLDLDLTRRLGTLSKGNRQKVGLLLALMHRPDLLLLDEPTDGLDPLAQDTVLALLREARAQGRTVFLSSHALGEVERVADRVGIIRQGRLIRSERLADLRASLPQRLQVRFRSPPRVDLAALPGLSEPSANGLDFSGIWRGSPDALIRALAGETLASLTLRESTLEEAFLGEYRQPEPGHVA